MFCLSSGQYYFGANISVTVVIRSRITARPTSDLKLPDRRAPRSSTSHVSTDCKFCSLDMGLSNGLPKIVVA
jgi:hypothetical protein